MEYDKLSKNRHVDALIHRCFEYISGEDAQKFVKKFREQPHDSEEIMNTVRELLLGAYLCSQGFNAKYEYAIEGYTPDWSVFDQNSMLLAIVELTNFHIDKVTQYEIEEQEKTKRIVTYWQDSNKDNVSRLYTSITEKALKYKNLLAEKGLAYIVAVFSDLHVEIDFKEELCPILFTTDQGIFKMHSWVSGVLFFETRANGQYSFYYALNPESSNTLPVAIFPPIRAA